MNVRTTHHAKSSVVAKALKDAIADGVFREYLYLSEDLILSKIRDSINSSPHDQGEKRAQISISLTPVRRAIAQLESEGILIVESKKGTRIRIPNDSELKCILDSLIALEEFCLVRLASQRVRNIQASKTIHEATWKILRQDVSSITLTDNERREILENYNKFHFELVASAGYPSIADELQMLRYKLQIAVPVERYCTKRRLFAIQQEHQAILDTLEGKPISVKTIHGNRQSVFVSHDRESESKTVSNNVETGNASLHPDINAVRHAFLLHMRNFCRDSLRIEQRMRDDESQLSPDFVFDVPDFDFGNLSNSVALTNLVELRLNVELCAVARLAMASRPNLSILESINSEMRSLAEQFRTDDADEEVAFFNHDIDFHCCLCFLAGMTFAEELLTFVWHSLRRFRKGGCLTQALAREIVKEHDDIIDSLRSSRGSDDDIADATAALRKHMFQAMLRSNFDETMIDMAIKQQNERLTWYTKYAQTP